VSIHTPAIPPNIPTTNIIKRIRVLEEVGNISDAIKLADDPAGEVKKNITLIRISSEIRSETY